MASIFMFWRGEYLRSGCVELDPIPSHLLHSFLFILLCCLITYFSD
jgi:hypothetical protein